MHVKTCTHTNTHTDMYTHTLCSLPSTYLTRGEDLPRLVVADPVEVEGAEEGRVRTDRGLLPEERYLPLGMEKVFHLED